MVKTGLTHLLALPLGLFSLIFHLGPFRPLQPSGLERQPLAVQWRSPWLQQQLSDPAVQAMVASYLKTLEDHGLSQSEQGIWIQPNHSKVVEHQGTLPLPAASLTKLTTTLAALHTWPVHYQFDTLVGFTGKLKDGVIDGNLVVQGGGDPLFVWEEAIVLANRLQELGIRRVRGDLQVIGPFTMNFDTDPKTSAKRLYRIMRTATWPRAAWRAYATLPPGTARPNLTITGSPQIGVQQTGQPTPTWLVRHQSVPLIGILKAMNIYSNNSMAQEVTDLAGGAAAVAAIAAQATALPPAEISLVNGSGLGLENCLSPRAVVALSLALQKRLSQDGYGIGDVLPVAGQDRGTLTHRYIPASAAVKTGTLDQVSALAGVLPTAQGPVWFAIINRGWAIPYLRQQQDTLLQALQSHWGAAETLNPLANRLEDHFQYGDPGRNQAP
ncbi:MAG: D-alanyl-D-alanine carboxypeptidase [Cyanobacteria bacterium REEB459]|nr:D-alanyl-D-alanine carboxypeptidase [Cyanobacteria bacterium REEB459]